MKTYFCSRHPGAQAWIKRQPLVIDEMIEHIHDLSIFQPGDRVIGNAPLQVVSALCAQGVEFWNIELKVPQKKRGTEINEQEMETFDVDIRRYEVKPLADFNDQPFQGEKINESNANFIFFSI